MITCTILLTIAIAITLIALVTIGTVGAGLLVVFGDFIAFGLIVWLVTKIIKLFKRKK